MRRSVWAASALAVFGLVSSASAQVGSPFLGGVDPAKITNRPINMTNLVAPAPAFTNTASRFSFTNLFRKFSNFGQPTIGTSPLPSPSSFPSTHYPNKIQPRPPILSGIAQ